MKPQSPFAFSRAGLIALVWLLTFLGSFAAPERPIVTSQEVDDLFQAIQNNDTNAIQSLYAHNTNVFNDTLYAGAYSGRYPLLQAVADGRMEIVALLLKYGASPNLPGDTRNSGGAQMTALHTAIQFDQPNICKLLLAAGADPNRMRFGFETALHQAFAQQRDEMAGWLLDYGADPFREKLFTNDKTTPFEVHIMRGDGKLAPRMLGQATPDSGALKPARPLPWKKSAAVTRNAMARLIADRGGALLAAAVQRGEVEAVQALLKAGVSGKEDHEPEVPLIQTFALAEAAAAGTEHFDSKRWLRIRDLLLKNGAEYDAFAVTALGDLDQAKRLLSRDRNVVGARDREGQTPLQWAARAGQLPMTSFWLQAGASPAATNFAGQTALHLAAANGRTQVLTVLLAAQAPTDARDTNGWTPLDAAIRANQVESIHLLLGDKTVAPRPGRALALPIHEAAARGDVGALSKLTESRNDLEARDELGLTPLQVAVRHGHLAAAALLVDKGADVNARDPEGNTLLHWIIPACLSFRVSDLPPADWVAQMAQRPGKEKYVKQLEATQSGWRPHPVLQAAGFLLACGIDVQATNHAGLTATQLAMDEKIPSLDFRTPLLKLLGKSDGGLNQADADGNTALHLSGRDATSDRIASLIAAGADINATNRLGQTPLHKFAENIGGWDLNENGTNLPFQLLVASKANVNAQDNDGLTPLHVLALSDTSFKKEATALLLAAGANPRLTDKHGRTAVHDFLSGEFPWSEAGECINLLVKAGADLSARDDQGRTPLHYLAALGNNSALLFRRSLRSIFENAGVNFQARDINGDTPLHIAARTRTDDVFRWLASRGDLDATNNAGETPRLLAARKAPFLGFSPNDAQTDICQAARTGNIEAARRLLEADPALVNRTDAGGETPLHAAVLAHRTNMIEFLEKRGAHWNELTAILAGRAEILRGILRQRSTTTAGPALDRNLVDLAVGGGDPEIVRMLLEANADAQAADFWGLSPLGEALLKKRSDLAELLRQHGVKENFFDAVGLGDLKTVSAFLASDKSLVYACNNAGASVAEIAAGQGNADVLKVLLAKGASVNAVISTDGSTPLHVAAIGNQTNTVQLLLRHGANVEAYDRSGLTPLHYAALFGSVEAATLLLKNKANPNAGVIPPNTLRLEPLISSVSPLTGNTPLHLAALVGQTNFIVLMLKSGAAINAGNSYGMTALDLASRSDSVPGTLFLHLGLRRGAESPFMTYPRPRASLPSLIARRKVAAALLEAAGGKRANEIKSLR